MLPLTLQRHVSETLGARSLQVKYSFCSLTHTLGILNRIVCTAERGRLINKLADLMERDKDELATLDALDNGKSFVIARDVDITDSIACYRYFAGWADKIHGKTIDTTHDKWCYTRHEPLGVVGAVIPW